MNSGLKIEKRLMATKGVGIGRSNTHNNDEWRKSRFPGTVSSHDVEEGSQRIHSMPAEVDYSNKHHKWKRFWQNSIPASLLAETSIHGVKYIAQKDRHWFERLFWLISFILGVLSFGYLIHGVRDRYNKTPVIVNFDAKRLSNNLIPFPAVTICNDHLISRRKVEELEKTVRENPFPDPKYRDARSKLRLVSNLWKEPASLAVEFGRVLEHREKYRIFKNTHDIFEFLMDTPPCHEWIRACKFGGHQSFCFALFEPIITAYGKCCTFNILPPQLLFKNLTPVARAHWAESELDNWATGIREKPPDFLNASFPYRPQHQVGAGQLYGLSVLISPDPDDYYCGISFSEGPRFIIHSPFEMPRLTGFSSVAHTGKEVRVDVSADVTRVDDDIQRFLPEKRECVFPNERQLQSLAVYTRANCIEECTAEYLSNRCGCTPFPLSHYDKGLSEKKWCSFLNIQCAPGAKLDLQYELDKFCGHCDPLCEEIKYSTQITMSNLKSMDRLLYDYPADKRPEWTTNNNSTLTLIHVFFGSEDTIPKLRKALYGITDLIANTGGMLGLCLGFSVLSGIELVYFVFVTLRTIFKHRPQWTIMACTMMSVTNTLKSVFGSKSRVVKLDDSNRTIGEGSNNSGWI